MACPSHLGLARDANDAGKVCLLQNLRVRDRVLPADVEKVSEASEMELVKMVFMSCICGPGFRAVE